jgi:hypothetical protein
MSDQVVAIIVTEAERARLDRLHDMVPGFGKNGLGFMLIEDVISRKVWDALPKEPS